MLRRAFALWCGTQSSYTVSWRSARQFGVIDVTDRQTDRSDFYKFIEEIEEDKVVCRSQH